MSTETSKRDTDRADEIAAKLTRLAEIEGAIEGLAVGLPTDDDPGMFPAFVTATRRVFTAYGFVR